MLDIKEMAIGSLSKIRILAGATLAILSFATFCVVIFVLLKSALLGTDFIPVNVLKIAIASFILLIASHLSLKSKFIYWFVPVQAFAFAAIIAGVATIVSMALGNWRLLFRFDGIMGLSSLVFGLAISWSANRLLARYNKEPD